MKKAVIILSALLIIILIFNLLTYFQLMPYAQEAANKHKNIEPCLVSIYFGISVITAFVGIRILKKRKNKKIFVLFLLWSLTALYWTYNIYSIYCLECGHRATIIDWILPIY
jgi:uncharacterized membrane protein